MDNHTRDKYNRLSQYDRGGTDRFGPRAGPSALLVFNRSIPTMVIFSYGDSLICFIYFLLETKHPKIVIEQLYFPPLLNQTHLI
jgi:hypothetical protein